MARKVILKTKGASLLPMQADSEAPRTTGTKLIKVQPSFSTGNGPMEARVDYPGSGLVIVRGAGGFGATGQFGTNLPQITMLRGAERVSTPQTPSASGPDDNGTMEGRTFQSPEVYDGAVLPGRFDHLHFRWGTGAQNNIPEPIWVRVIEPSFGRAVYTAPGGPPLGTSWATDWFVKAALEITAASTKIYSDHSEPTDWSDVPTIGQGVGADTNEHNLGHSGPARKRRMVGWLSCGQPFSVAVGTTSITGTAFIPQYVFRSVTRAFNGGSQFAVCDFTARPGGDDKLVTYFDDGEDGSASAASLGWAMGQQNQGLILPGGHIEIQAALDSAGTEDLVTSLSFMGG
jgi:hypothetical protein